MADPVLVPATPTVKQGEKIVAPSETPGDTSPGMEAVQRAFDKVYPMKGGAEKPPAAAPVEPPPITSPEPVIEAPRPTETPPVTTTPAEPAPERKLPSFLEDALKVDGAQPVTPPPQTEEDWPEELPELKTDESKNNWKKFRGEYKKLKEQLKSRPDSGPLDEQTQARLARMETLENANKEMQVTLSRFGVEQNAEFQQNVMQPLHAAWGEAARIVKDSGRDPQELAQAMSLTGKAQFERLDEIFEGMPESAKAEVHDAIRAYRHFEGQRKNAIANAPKTFEALRKKELERQYQVLNSQKQEMVTFFDDAVKTLRDEAKVEILQTTSDPDASWWNDQGNEIVTSARDLYLENTDMRKMAIACVLAPMADKYRKLWMSERVARSKAERTLKDKFGAEPSLSESSGPASGSLMPDEKIKQDLKRPFADVFLEQFHKEQARSR